ncbi:MAG: tRNA (adenosine(37)-N6)-dimethylallyltransferase MiaA [bacterium]
MISNLIIITGQTATGKTKLAYDLAKKHNGELVSCDSRQIYKRLDIITGKEILPDIKTHLINIVDPKEQFSSFDYVQLAIPLIKSLQNRGVTPVIVGGTYLYLKHLLYGIDTNVPANWKLRDKLNKKSVKQLQNILKNLSVQTFERLNQSDQNNPHRLIRKIEISTNTKENSEDTNFFPTWDVSHISAKGTHRSEKNSVSSYLKFDRTHQFIGLHFKNKESLKKAIEKRVEQRIKNGAFQEVKHLIKLGYKPTDPGLNTIGYKQLIKYYLGTISKDKPASPAKRGEAIEQWIIKELQYAKRQYTFMKKDKNINWKLI